MKSRASYDLPLESLRFLPRPAVAGRRLRKNIQHREHCLVVFWSIAAILRGADVPPIISGVGEITFAATPRCAVASGLPEEQPARKARMIVAASVAANIDIARPDLLYIIEVNLHLLRAGERG